MRCVKYISPSTRPRKRQIYCHRSEAPRFNLLFLLHKSVAPIFELLIRSAIWRVTFAGCGLQQQSAVGRFRRATMGNFARTAHSHSLAVIYRVCLRRPHKPPTSANERLEFGARKHAHMCAVGSFTPEKISGQRVCFFLITSVSFMGQHTNSCEFYNTRAHTCV